MDTHEAQAERVANYLERNPGATLQELTFACRLGCASKVVSVMRRELGYGVHRATLREDYFAEGPKRRYVRTYTLTHRPAPVRQLSLPLD